MKKYHQHTLLFLIAGSYFILFLNDYNLYPKLSYLHLGILSALRFVLLVLPILLGFLIVKYKQKKLIKYTLLIFWLLFLPYTIYSITEIRHVSELCRLPDNLYYTEYCVTKLWSLIPVFLYATIGSLSFVFSVSQVTSNLFIVSRIKQFVILVLCFIGSFASVFGLYTRINIWEIFTHPSSTLYNLMITISQENFLENVFIYTIFVVGYFFVTNRLIRQMYKFIF